MAGLVPTTYDEEYGIRLQFANLFNRLLLGSEDNTFRGEDGAVWNPVQQHQGVTPDGRYYTVGYANGAPMATGAVTIPTGMLLLGGAVLLAYVAMKG